MFAKTVKELDSADYESRTIRNVEDCDGLLIIINNNFDEGTILAMESAEKLGKAVYIQDAGKDISIREFHQWIKDNQIKVLNVAGPRESNSPGIYNHCLNILNKLLDA